MTDYRPLCWECQERMFAEKNGIRIRYSSDQLQSGDRYKCPSCGKMIVIGWGMPFLDPEICAICGLPKDICVCEELARR